MEIEIVDQQWFADLHVQVCEYMSVITSKVVKFDYEMEEKNPMHEMWFYIRPNEAVKVHSDQLSPVTFIERNIHIIILQGIRQFRYGTKVMIVYCPLDCMFNVSLTLLKLHVSYIKMMLSIS